MHTENTDREGEKINIYPGSSTYSCKKGQQFHQRITNFNHEKCNQGVSNSEKNCIDRESVDQYQVFAGLHKKHVLWKELSGCSMKKLRS